jgi:hypothetical protein
MFAKREEHIHPVSGETANGYALEPGDVLQKGDLYDSTTGKWSECPCPGHTIGNNDGLIWIRPNA